MTIGTVIALIKALGSGGGGGGGGLLVNVTEQGDSAVCDKTAGEIMAVLDAGGSVVFKKEDEEEGFYTYEVVSNAQTPPDKYYFYAGITYTANSASDYPAHGGK